MRKLVFIAAAIFGLGMFSCQAPVEANSDNDSVQVDSAIVDSVVVDTVVIDSVK